MFCKGSTQLVILLFASMMLVAGCPTSQTPISGIDSSVHSTLIDLRVGCELLPQRSYSRNDTESTRRHIVGDNAAKKELCSETKPE